MGGLDVLGSEGLALRIVVVGRCAFSTYSWVNFFAPDLDDGKSPQEALRARPVWTVYGQEG